ncbi:MAG: lipopolysaccharide heptosyltransferase I [Gammaproteobacteria bacterium]
MQRVLVVKTSSLGDIVHTLPALTDAAGALGQVRFDWVLEENFAEIPTWHPAVERVIPVALRRWRKDWGAARSSGEWGQFKDRLRSRAYDRVIDAQGLIKSAWLTRMSRGVRIGLSWTSARESLASLAYDRRVPVPKDLHAVERVRRLFADALDYPPPTGVPEFGLQSMHLPSPLEGGYVVFLHGTTWATKHYPEGDWAALVRLAGEAGFQVALPWGNESERQRAERLALAHDGAVVLPRMDLHTVAGLLAGARGVVSVDTGLSHLAAALAVPQVCIYGPTDPARTGTVGRGQLHARVDYPCAPCFKRACPYAGIASQPSPCFATVSPEAVWRQLGLD